MKPDLTSILHDWPFRPGKVNARLITGDDGRRHVQVRLDVGILQMQVRGRPDGTRPEGFESLLEYYEAWVEEPGGEGAEGRLLSPDDCRLLRDEAVQFYHRYIALLILTEYEGVYRDTTRNLRVLDLCREYAEREDDQQVLEQFRPYLVMMRCRALASQCVTDDEPKAALFVIDHGLEEIRAMYDEAGQAEDYDQSSEVTLLRGMRAELMKKLPASQKTELKQRLQQAIEAENYELAAILRDELNNLRDHA